MNNDLNRNTRTLIVGFVVAIMAMIPLRFVEVGQLMENYQNAAVLGASAEVALPNAEVTPEAVLEAPYNVIDGQATAKSTCISPNDSAVFTKELKERIVNTKMDRAEMENTLTQIEAIESNTCK